MSLPNFMVLGASKSATTTLYNILKNHDEIYAPSFKEPHFFNITKNFKKGLDWYENTYYNTTINYKAVIDFTPTYLYTPNCAQRIYENLGPDMKFIVILRNPVDRAYSHYLHSKRDGYENKDFMDALICEKSRIDISRQEDDILSELRFSYLAQGDYHRMLSDYLKYYSLDNFLIINFESEIANGLELTRIRIADFLDIDLSNLDLDLHSNKSGKPRFSFLQKIMMKNGFCRQALKFCFSSITRQRIRNKIKNFNKINHDFMPLTQQIKIELYKKYFMEDVLSLEKLLNRNMFWSNL